MSERKRIEVAAAVITRPDGSFLLGQRAPGTFYPGYWEFPGGIQKRLHLHARRIVIPHPNSGVIDVTAPLPGHMVQSWNLLGFDEATAEDEAQ